MSAGDVSNDERFQAINTRDSEVRAIAFSGYAESDGDFSPDITTYHHLVGVFTSNRIYCYHDGDVVDAGGVAWSPSAVTLNQVRIGETASLSWSDMMNGYIAHAAMWTAELSADDVADLYDLSVNPLDIESENIICYLPLRDDMTDEVGDLSWTAVNLSSPSYEDEDIDYPTAGGEERIISGSHTLGGLSLSGSVGVTSMISGSHTLGGLSQSGSIDVLQPIVVDGSHTLVGLSHSGAITQTSIIEKLNNLSMKRVWFGHQSVGNYMVHGPADNDAYGIAKFVDDNEGYITVVDGPTDLDDIPRGTFAESYVGSNGNAGSKLTAFNTAARNSFSGVDFAILKFCWVDFHSGSTITNTGQADTFFATLKSTWDSLISDFPNTRFIICTVPLTPNDSDGGNTLREYFSGLVRTEYAADGIVFDLADWESRNARGQLELYSGVRELNAAWDIGDGGHPNSAGSDMLGINLLTMLSGMAEYLNVFDGAHALTGLSQTGTITVGDIFTVSGSHTFDTFTQTGTIDLQYTISGSHTLGGLSQSGDINLEQMISGSHTLSGLSQSGTIDLEQIISGSHSIGGLIQSGNIDVIGSYTVSGEHSLGGLSQSGSIGLEYTITGSHSLGGVTQSGSVAITYDTAEISGGHALPTFQMIGNILNATVIIYIECGNVKLSNYLECGDFKVDPLDCGNIKIGV